MARQVDLAVIGGGPGGYVAAIRGAQLGLSTVVIEAENMGGVCLNWGCIPTKALLESAHTLHRMRTGKNLGLEAGELRIDFSQVIRHSRQAARRLSKGVEFLMKKNGIRIIPGRGKLVAENEIEITGARKKSVLRAGKIIIATGARPKVIPGLEPDGSRVWTAREALTPKELPQSLIIIGAGAIGVEFADFYHEMGAAVTLVEMLPGILPMEDEDLSKALKSSFVKRGIQVRTGTLVAGIKALKTRVKVELEQHDERETITAEAVLVAVGVTGNGENLGLEKVGVTMEQGFIPVDAYCRTTRTGIYAIGDVTGPPLLAHVASAQGHVAAEHAAGLSPHPVRSDRIPGCTYCRPQVASVGFTEAEARRQGLKVKVGRFDFRANGKATATGQTEGFIKLIFDETYGELVGAHILGENATELIAEMNLALTLEATWDEVGNTIHAHPTLSEAVMEAALDAQGKAIHH